MFVVALLQFALCNQPLDQGHYKGQTFYQSGYDVNGGVFYSVIDSPADILIENCTFWNCHVYSRTTQSGHSGGAIYITKTNLTLRMQTVNFINCTCDSVSYGGGAIYMNEGSLFMDECYFQANRAWNMSGGAIYGVALTSVAIAGSAFSGNHARGAGGAVFFSEAKSVIISGCLFSNCTSQAAGGAVYCDGNYSLVIASTLIQACRSSMGGAACVQNLVEFTVFNCSITNNTSPSGCSGIDFTNITKAKVTASLVQTNFGPMSAIRAHSSAVVNVTGTYFMYNTGGTASLEVASFSELILADVVAYFAPVAGTSNIVVTGSTAPGTVITNCTFQTNSSTKVVDSWHLYFDSGANVRFTEPFSCFDMDKESSLRFADGSDPARDLPMFNCHPKPPTEPAHKGGLGAGATAAIVIVVLVLLAAGAVIAFVVIKKRRGAAGFQKVQDESFAV